jgi:hypothetical protein
MGETRSVTVSRDDMSKRSRWDMGLPILELLPPFRNIRYFSFMKLVYLDIFQCIDLSESIH